MGKGAPASSSDPVPEGIAVIGMGCVFPDAPDVDSFWANIKAKRDSIREVPRERWDPDLFWSDDRNAEDKTYAKIGAFITESAANPLDFRIPPKVWERIDPSQQWALSATKQALEDAGYDDREFDRERVGVILGNSMGGEIQRLYTQRVYLPYVEGSLRESGAIERVPADERAEFMAEFTTHYKSRFPTITEDSMPGELSNVISGRVAQVFNLRGQNNTTDAACASTLAAIDAACKALRTGELDMMISGGSDCSMEPTSFVKFSKIGALSARGSSPFDAKADGFVMGEGCGILILKRELDARRDGDRIYAVIRGIGASSDGKGKGITAPNVRGQHLALARSLAASGFDPHTIGLIEAHGTATKVGDAVEIESLRTVFPDTVPRQSIGLGSIKSQIGHLKSAAAAASMIKMIKAIETATLPPSINFETPNPNCRFPETPFFVVTEAQPWTGPHRRGMVSSFGFGGTNFNASLEANDPDRELVPMLGGATRVATPAPMALAPSTTPPISPVTTTVTTETSIDAARFAELVQDQADLEEEVFLFGAGSREEMVSSLKATIADSGSVDHTNPGSRMRDLAAKVHSSRNGDAIRVGITAKDPTELVKKIGSLMQAFDKPERLPVLAAQGIHVGEGPQDGKVAFLFPGQGSQYTGMLADVGRKYASVKTTWDEADRIMTAFIPKALSSYVYPDVGSKEERATAEEELRQTEYCQPAVLTADSALLRILEDHGIEPDMLAGHSLGEYGALQKAGIMTFTDALVAVSARGKHMANVRVEDLGKMASVAADAATTEEVLADCKDYVIAANKNCNAQTVIAGSSAGVDEAVALFKEKAIDTVFLPVSAAFHSEIVAPACEPYRHVLDELDLKPPRIPILTNVTADYYPTGDDAIDWIRSNLEVQIASAVEWQSQVERMYADGARLFVEVGPKRALTGFVLDILGRQGVRAVAANHPKKGGIFHLNDTLAAAWAHGLPVRLPELDSELFTAEYRDLAAKATITRTVPAPNAAPPMGAAAPAVTAPATAVPSAPAIVAGVSQDTAIAELSTHPAFQAYLATHGGPLREFVRAGFEQFLATQGAHHAPSGFHGTIVVSGMSVGLPGKHKHVFDPDNADRILRGENLIDEIPLEHRQRMIDKNVRRLIKKADGSATLEVLEHPDQALHWAGQAGAFDLAKDYDINPRFAESFDRAIALAVAAGIEALRSARIPLVREYTKATTGKMIPGGWVLPQELQARTGIIFASAWPAINTLTRSIVKHTTDRFAKSHLRDLEKLYLDLVEDLDDPDKRRKLAKWYAKHVHEAIGPAEEDLNFDSKFLFSVLSMGHSQLAQLIKAKGPNTQVNSACSSTTVAMAIAEDWIRLGRCDRVLVVGGDDITNEDMFEWIGTGFLISGAATAKKDLSEAAIPFDRRREGLIMGMGAVGLVVEHAELAAERGIEPLVELLGVHVVNSAFHGSRLDVEHIAGEFDLFWREMERRHGLDRHRIAPRLLFMSHETFTPARGGSAAAEVASLKLAFGDAYSNILISNTKGYTGHPMGAGIEDIIAIRALQTGIVPPIANLKELDPDLGNLRFSKPGEKHDLEYALRFSAGFGSQLGLSLYRRISKLDDRLVDKAAHQAWLVRVTGYHDPTEEVVFRTLRIRDQGPPSGPLLVTSSIPHVAGDRHRLPPATPAPGVAAPGVIAPSAIPGSATPPAALATTTIPAPPVAPVAPTTPVAPVAPTTPVAPVASATPAPAAPVATAGGAKATLQPGSDLPSKSAAELQAAILEIIVDQTGYPQDMLDPALDLEADLGIDTVKQAEIFSLLRARFAFEIGEGLQIKDYPTVNGIVAMLQELGQHGSLGGAPAELAPTPASAPVTAEVAPAGAPASAPAMATTSTPAEVGPKAKLNHDSTLPGKSQAELTEVLLDIIVDQTGYPRDMLATDLDLEADLGIDTVKQAEVFSLLRQQFGFEIGEGLQIKDYPTIDAIVAMLLDLGATGQIGGLAPTPEVEAQAEPTPAVDAQAAPIPTAPTPATPAPATSGPKARLLPDSDLPSKSREELEAAILDIIVDQTGYPRDMLEVDLDLEADLGIDTVKQAEVFSLLRAQFGFEIGEGLQIKDYPTIALIAEMLLELGASSQVGSDGDAATSAVAPPSLAAPPAAAVVATDVTPAGPKARLLPDSDLPSKSREELEAAILDIIVDQTGYPRDMLEVDLDLEADLGIDTVKQAEVFSLLRAQFGFEIGEGLQIKDYPTIALIAEMLLDLGTSGQVGDGGAAVAAPASVTTPEPAPEATPEPASEPIPEPPQADFRRYGVTLAPYDLPAPVPVPGRSILWVGDEQAGLTFAEATTVARITLADLSSSSSVPEASVELWVDARGMATGNLQGDEDQLVGVYHLIRSGLGQWQRAALIVDLAGNLGTAGKPHPIQGAMAGLFKGLRREVDFPVHVIDAPAGSALEVPFALPAEAPAELAFTDGWQWVQVRPAPNLGEPDPPTADSYFLISGGGQGIAAEIAIAIAERWGSELVLLGRTPVPEDPAEFRKYTRDTLEEKKTEIMEALKATGERVTPVMVETAFGQFRKRWELLDNLARMEAAGSKVTYLAVDVTDKTALVAAVGPLKEKRGFTHVIHAAGIEISHRIADKDLDEFRSVFNVKAAGAMNLLSCIDADEIKAFHAFSSVAGRFGNATQLDYSAANDWLTKLCQALRARGLPALAIHWSAWAGVGMATRGSVMKIMEMAGVIPIPLSIGLDLYLTELERDDGRAEIVIAGALGRLDADGQVSMEPLVEGDGEATDRGDHDTEPGAEEGPAQVSSEPSAPIPLEGLAAELQERLTAGAFPLLDRVLSATPASAVIEHTMDQEVDLYLRDHAIDGIPYVPGVMGLEIFAEASRLFVSGDLVSIRDIEYNSPIKLLRGKPIIVRVEVTKVDDTTTNCELLSDFIGPDGRKLGETRRHFKGTLVFGERTAGAFTMPEVADWTSLTQVDHERIYDVFFHGLRFQVLDRVERQGSDWLEARYKAPIGGFFKDDRPEEFSSMPMEREALFQAAGVAEILATTRMGLPAGIRAGTIHAGEFAGPFKALIKRKPDQDGFLAYDCYLLDAAGQLVMSLTDYLMVITGDLEEGIDIS